MSFTPTEYCRSCKILCFKTFHKLLFTPSVFHCTCQLIHYSSSQAFPYLMQLNIEHMTYSSHPSSHRGLSTHITIFYIFFTVHVPSREFGSLYQSILKAMNLQGKQFHKFVVLSMLSKMHVQLGLGQTKDHTIQPKKT